jgi:DNA-binding Lrp family transcriptional regulator
MDRLCNGLGGNTHARVRARCAVAYVAPQTGFFLANEVTRAQMPLELDKLDRKILALLQKDARLSAESIGAEVGLSASAVQRRTARLREDAVIMAEVAIVDPRSVGLALTVIVDLEVEREHPEQLTGLKRWIAGEAAIQQAWYVTGDDDYVLIVSARDVDTYEALMQKLLADNTNVRRYRTRVALGTLKRGLAVPVDAS